MRADLLVLVESKEKAGHNTPARLPGGRTTYHGRVLARATMHHGQLPRRGAHATACEAATLRRLHRALVTDKMSASAKRPTGSLFAAGVKRAASRHHGHGGDLPSGKYHRRTAGRLAERRSGVAPIRVEARPALARDLCRAGLEFTGHIDDFGPLEGELKKAIRKGLKVMCRESQMGVAAAQRALEDAGPRGRRSRSGTRRRRVRLGLHADGARRIRRADARLCRRRRPISSSRAGPATGMPQAVARCGC